MEHTISRRSIREQVAELITDRIVSGYYEPGARLRELELASELGVSQGPVREAFRDLAAQRLIVCEPHRGTYVRGMDKAEMLESYQVRAVLERLACELIVAGGSDTGPARERAESARRAAAIGDRAGYAERDFEFHRAVVASACNATLLRHWDDVWSTTRARVQLTMARTVGVSVDIERLAGAHFAVLDALDAGDGALAGLLLHDHVLQVRSFVDQLVPEGILSLREA